jgi:hypothetical protein
MAEPTCMRERREAGLPYPRTCQRCGLFGVCYLDTVLPRVKAAPAGAPAPKPSLLRVPTHFHSVAEVLGAAAQMDLPNLLLLSERDDGSLVFLDSGLTMAECNWMLDKLKALMLAPQQPTHPETRPDTGGAA